MQGKVFKGGSRNSATFKMEFLATIGKGRNLQRAWSDGLTTNRQYLHVAVVIRPSLQPKLKTNENSHAWKVAPDTLCFVDMFFTFFRKRRLHSVWLTFCFNSKLVSLSISSSGVLLFRLTGFLKQASECGLKNVANKMQGKRLWRSSFLKKLKTKINLF